MALRIRLRQQGNKNRQTYRIVVADARVRRDGKYVEKLGFYIPYLAENNCEIDADRIMYWLKQGAQMSEQVRSLATKTAPGAIKLFNEQKEELKAKKVAKKRAKKEKEKA